jgi:hypothetical protein
MDSEFLDTEVPSTHATETHPTNSHDPNNRDPSPVVVDDAYLDALFDDVSECMIKNQGRYPQNFLGKNTERYKEVPEWLKIKKEKAASEPCEDAHVGLESDEVPVVDEIQSQDEEEVHVEEDEEPDSYVLANGPYPKAFKCLGDVMEILDWRKVLTLRFGDTTLRKDQAPLLDWKSISDLTGLEMYTLQQCAYPMLRAFKESNLESLDLLTQEADQKLTK